MDTIAAIIAEKSAGVVTVAPDATVTQAVEVMCRKRIGAVLVCDSSRCSGIFSERDLMNRVVLAGLDPHSTRVATVMTADVVCVDPAPPASEAMALMPERHCRHLPVMSGNRVAAVVSIGDLVRWESRHQAFHVRMLTDYIQGKYPG